MVLTFVTLGSELCSYRRALMAAATVLTVAAVLAIALSVGGGGGGSDAEPADGTSTSLGSEGGEVSP